MTFDQFRNALSDLLARASDLPLDDIISEVEMVLDGLRDDAANREDDDYAGH